MSERKDSRVVVILTYHEDTGALDVFMADEVPEFGSVKRVVETDGISLGVSRNGSPVFIRIADAHTRTKTFSTIARYAKRGKPIGALQQTYVAKFCNKMAEEILHLDKRHRTPKVAKFVFSSVA